MSHPQPDQQPPGPTNNPRPATRAFHPSPVHVPYLLAATAAVLSTAGCDRAPSYSILGSFFPVWLLCFIIGMLLTFAVHLLLQRLRLANQLAPAVLVYPSLTALFTMALWLIFYS